MSQSLAAEWAVNQMVVAGCSFSEIEDYIEELTLGTAQKSVLWLWAWAEQPRVERHTLMPLEREDCARSLPARPPEEAPRLHNTVVPPSRGRWPGGRFRNSRRKAH